MCGVWWRGIWRGWVSCLLVWLWVPVLGCVFGYVVEVCVGWYWDELVLWCWGCGVGDEVGLVLVVAGVVCVVVCMWRAVGWVGSWVFCWACWMVFPFSVWCGLVGVGGLIDIGVIVVFIGFG